ncbi:MAG TPA: hypothetical protein VFH43_13490 [Candidatus Kapabacteria bacterium]|nr:hypothetical protein [Candidatus Kapabacteria bacterium]
MPNQDLLTQHPISTARTARIDVFFGGNQYDVAEDMMLLMEQTVELLQPEEHIMVLNTMCVHDDLASAADKLGKGKPGKITVYSASGTLLREKLDFLAKTITAKKVRMIILNSWEFAALGSRQKHALAMWLREVRDASKLRVVVYTREKEIPKFGALAMLCHAASSCDDTGAWTWNGRYAADKFYPNMTDTVNEYIEHYEARRAESSKGGMTMPRKKRYGLLNIVTASELIDSLKNKDLRAVSAHPPVLEAEMV